MPEEIIPGIDCCADAFVPTRPPRVYPTKIDLAVNESVQLFLKAVHHRCYAHCFSWHIVQGVGWLAEGFGTENWYHAPHESAICTQSPVIEVYCGLKRIAKFVISVNGFGYPAPAALWAHEWQEEFFVFWMLYSSMKVAALRYKDLHPDYAVIRVDELGCGGDRLRRYQWAILTLAQEVRGRWQLVHGKYVPLILRTVDVPLFDLKTLKIISTTETQKLPQLYRDGYDIWKPWEEAKQYRLYHAFHSMLSGLPTRSKLASKLTKHTWLPTLPDTIHPKEVVDVRSVELAERGCCNYEMLAEEMGL